MLCIIEIKSGLRSGPKIGDRHEYLIRFHNENHIISVKIKSVWPKARIIFGEAFLLVDNIVLPLMCDLLGAGDSDVRGWALLLDN